MKVYFNNSCKICRSEINMYKKENIEAASKLGFLTIHLTNPEIITLEINIFIWI